MKKKKGKEKKKFGNTMSPLFGVTAKKPEPDVKPPAKNPNKTRAARMARLHGKLI